MPKIGAGNCSDDNIELSLKRRMDDRWLFSLVLCFILNSNTTHLHISRRLHSISQIPIFLPKMALGLANLVLSKSVSMCRFRKFFLEIVHRHIIDFSSFFLFWFWILTLQIQTLTLYFPNPTFPAQKWHRDWQTWHYLNQGWWGSSFLK